MKAKHKCDGCRRAAINCSSLCKSKEREVKPMKIKRSHLNEITNVAIAHMKQRQQSALQRFCSFVKGLINI